MHPRPASDRLKTALVYDFDGTLARGNIQEGSFIPSVGLSHKEFWDESKRIAKQGDADEILCYMQLILKKAMERGIPVTAEQFRQHGRCAALFPGLEDGSWFDRIDCFASQIELALEHYIVSSGTYEMI